MNYNEIENFELPSIYLLGYKEIIGKAVEVKNATNSSLYLGKSLIEFNLNFYYIRTIESCPTNYNYINNQLRRGEHVLK